MSVHGQDQYAALAQAKIDPKSCVCVCARVCVSLDREWSRVFASRVFASRAVAAA